jgi:hypothetical protein
MRLPVRSELLDVEPISLFVFFVHVVLETIDLVHLVPRIVCIRSLGIEILRQVLFVIDLYRAVFVQGTE